MIGMLMLSLLMQLLPANTVDCDPQMMKGKEKAHCAVESDAPKDLILLCVPIEDCAMGCIGGVHGFYVADKYKQDADTGNFVKTRKFVCWEAR